MRKRKEGMSEGKKNIIAALLQEYDIQLAEDIYGFEVSEGMVSDITDRLLPEIKDWQNRPLSEVYPIVYIDAVHFSVRDNHVIKKLAAYVILGISDVGKVIYTTNAIESLNSTYRRLNSQRSVF